MRARLISAGARVLASRGADKITIDDFISEAKVARGTFYNYFTTREELLEALWASYGHDPFYEIQRSCLTFAEPAEQIAAFVRLVLHRAQEDSTWGWLVVAITADQLDVAARRDMTAYHGPALQKGAAAGIFHFDDLQCAIDVVVGAMRGGLKAVLEHERDNSYPEALCKMILLSLGVDTPNAQRISYQPLSQDIGRPDGRNCALGPQ
jgi:Transcriptional regulator